MFENRPKLNTEQIDLIYRNIKNEL